MSKKMTPRNNPLADPEFQHLIQLLAVDLCGAEFVERGYQRYLNEYGEGNRARNGRIFELLIVESLQRAKIGPVYFQTEFQFVPNVAFDILLYHPVMPVVISCKTSLRERYKQAELEGFVLRQVYRRAQVFLITRNVPEGMSVQKKIEQKQLVGINECIILNREFPDFPQNYDHVLENLSDVNFRIAEPVEPLLKVGYVFPIR
ncbi:MAG: hypothetical protein OXG02_09145 [Chloroflexi bacterium]|nr:hypothetical protein [Chloroflexota bacterium]